MRGTGGDAAPRVGLRPIGAADRPAVLAWNLAHVEFLAPMDEARLEDLQSWARTAAFIECDGEAAGFVLTFAEGSPYDSENYRWFSARHARFCYLDRIVVDPGFRRRGVADAVYDLLEAEAAARGAETFCLEVNLEPRNDPSLAFHASRGFTEVGRQVAGGHLVSLQEKPLGTIRG